MDQRLAELAGRIAEALLGASNIQKNLASFVTPCVLQPFRKYIQRLSVLMFVQCLVASKVQTGSRTRQHFVHSVEISHPPITKCFEPDTLCIRWLDSENVISHRQGSGKITIGR